MKKAGRKHEAKNRMPDDEILPEYDFSRSTRNKYAARYAAGSLVVVLDPDVAAAFPNSKEANEALRALSRIMRNRQVRRSSSRP